VFISTTDKYGAFVDNCGMTQSIVFIMCANEEEAKIFTDTTTSAVCIHKQHLQVW
jgi:hypothetical protein